MAGSFFDRSPEQEYFQSLEEVMIELRGAPLQLSPDDWQVSRQWFQDDVPLELVAGAIREVVERRQEAEKEIPIRLRYYRRAVDKAWRQVEALTAPGRRGSATELDVAERLRNLAKALGEDPWLGDLPALLRGLHGDAQTVEDQMADLDRQLIEQAFRTCDESERRALSARIESALEAYGDRLPEAELEAARERLRAEILRRSRELPVLSLFAPEAVVDEASSGSTPRREKEGTP